MPRFGWERPRSASTKVLLPAAGSPEGDELIGNDREVGSIKGWDGRGWIAHGRIEEPDHSGRPLHDSGLLRPDVNRLTSERLESPNSAANGRQIEPDPRGSDDRRGKPHRDEVERAKLPEGDLLLDDKGGACEGESTASRVPSWWQCGLGAHLFVRLRSSRTIRAAREPWAAHPHVSDGEDEVKSPCSSVASRAPAITPLEKRKPSGELYVRDPGIESLLEDLSSLSRDELLERARASRRSDPAYVPSECLVYFVRASRRDNNDDWFERLYKILNERVLRSLPKPEGADPKTASYARSEIRDRAHGRFVELLATDRTSYQERLDFFEVRFDAAVANLRRDAQEQVWRDENRSDPLEADDETGELPAHVERASEDMSPFASFDVEDAVFRSRLAAAIDSLPPKLRSVIEMTLKEFPVDSQDPGVVTISGVLGLSEKTVRNYRKEAIAALRAALTDGGVP